MASYEKGDDNADEVKLIQQALGHATTGQFNAAMVAAVKAWQTARGATPDGVVGPDMLLALGLMQLLILENGDNGTLVQALQAKLGVSGDEDFGDATEAALKAYQKKNGLKANGRADAALLAKLGLTGPQAKPASASAPAAPISAPAAPAQAHTTTTGRLPIAAWAYQLADIDPAAIASLDVDLAVIDYSADGDDANAFKPADLAAMKRRPGGQQKKVAAYMSIGEAEDYRYYWQPAWGTAATRPTWLDALNPDWEGNYKVRFWDPAWQALILGSPQAYLDRIIAAGFDGVYLDIIDAFEYWRDEKAERPTADQDMIAFVKKIAAYARAKRPGFMIIPQNGEALLADASYRAVISAQAKEDIFYGGAGDGKANKKSDVSGVLEDLALARAEGIPIIAIEYLDDDAKISEAQTKLATAGCCATFGPRDLASLAPGLAKG